MKAVGKFYVHSFYFTAISYILWPFGEFCGHFGIRIYSILACCTKKNLATLFHTQNGYLNKLPASSRQGAGQEVPIGSSRWAAKGTSPDCSTA
jgi:hypothetical protein